MDFIPVMRRFFFHFLSRSPPLSRLSLITIYLSCGRGVPFLGRTAGFFLYILEWPGPRSPAAKLSRCGIVVSFSLTAVPFFSFLYSFLLVGGAVIP